MKIAILMGHARFTGVNTWIADLATGLAADILFLPIQSIDPDGKFYHPNMLEADVMDERDINYYDVLIVSYREHIVPSVSFWLESNEEYHGKIIYVVHGRGVYGNHYSLSGSRAKIDALVAVSDYVNEDVQCDVVIPHGVDTRVFYPMTVPIDREFLWHSRYAIPHALTEAVGGKVTKIPYESDQKTILRYIRSSRYVIGIGRSALEALACGKPTFSWAGAYGNPHSRKFGGYYDGWIGEKNFDELLRCNFNGTISHDVFNDVDEIRTALKFDGDNFERVSQDISAAMMVERYAKLIAELMP